MKKVQTSLASFQAYIYHPIYKLPLAERSDRTTATTLRQFLAEYPLLLGLLILSIISVSLTEFVAGEKLYVLFQQQAHSSFGLLLIALPLGILIEEIFFRSVLYLTPKRLKGIAILMLSTLFYYYILNLEETTNETVLLGVFFSWIVFLFMGSRYLKRPLVFARINTFWQSNFRWIFYGFTLLYAMAKIGGHLDTLATWQSIFLPVWLLSGLLSGFYFGYVRMKYGFWYAVVVHSLIVMASLAPEIICTL